MHEPYLYVYCTTHICVYCLMRISNSLFIDLKPFTYVSVDNPKNRCSLFFLCRTPLLIFFFRNEISKRICLIRQKKKNKK